MYGLSALLLLPSRHDHRDAAKGKLYSLPDQALNPLGCSYGPYLATTCAAYETFGFISMILFVIMVLIASIR